MGGEMMKMWDAFMEDYDIKEIHTVFFVLQLSRLQIFDAIMMRVICSVFAKELKDRVCLVFTHSESHLITDKEEAQKWLDDQYNLKMNSAKSYAIKLVGNEFIDPNPFKSVYDLVDKNP